MKKSKKRKIILAIFALVIFLFAFFSVFYFVSKKDNNINLKNEKDNTTDVKPEEATIPEENDNTSGSKPMDTTIPKDNKTDAKPVDATIPEENNSDDKLEIDIKGYQEKILNGAVPELDQGMIPIIYEDSTWKKANIDNEWYSYEKLNWANAVYVKKDKLKEYQEADAGTVIKEEDVLGYFVWIPRYEYKLFNVNNGKMNEQVIEVKFVSKKVAKKADVANDKFYTHPAFTAEYNDKSYELNGFWIAKFEPSLNSDKIVNILPGKHTLININFAEMWKYAKSVTKNYGASIESRMLTNMEWGAVAYLSQSNYGKVNNNDYSGNAKQIFLNTAMGDKDGNNKANDRVTTGCSSGTIDSDETANCPYNYDVPYYGTGASSTGTIYGVYDLAGGSWDCVMGIISSYPVKANIGGYNGSVPSNKRYYTLYKVDSNMYNRTRGKIGDATREVLSSTYKYPNGEAKGWNDDYAYFANANYPWIKRGGSYNDKTSSGIFSYGITLGTKRGDKTFRVVLSKY